MASHTFPESCPPTAGIGTSCQLDAIVCAKPVKSPRHSWGRFGCALASRVTNTSNGERGDTTMTHSLFELARPTAPPIGLGRAPASGFQVAPPSRETWIALLASA
jgi:hypothetical protein